ncbi:MAG: integral rane sensor signal transduction histidine kinase [Lachnospiraceae bacterium]|jgi:signal transduction histidine kinase|nr:integral rane sensor signal transduction histidine kinase [Lachnospiraceae bacterium]
MKLIHKNFLYTAIVISILTILVLGYFVFMLPSLYVDYMSNENYNSIVEQQNGYLKDNSYINVTVENPSCMTIDIPFSKDYFIITGKSFQTTITPTTDDMKKLLSDIKNYAKSNLNSFQHGDKNIEKNNFKAEFEEKVLEWKAAFMKQATFLDNLPFTIKTKSELSYYQYNWEESTKIQYLPNNTIIVEAGVNDGENHYTNYIGLTYNSDRIVISYLPTMTPQMNEITPIVIRSLPMLLAVIILFALVVSYLYTKGIVDPIIRLVKHTEAVKRSGAIANASLPAKGKDEIAMLIQTLNELYEELDNNYKALENKNNELKEKNKSQEVFLRSSSHQLKTPIAAALLLVDGMINQIGKYQDVKAYLPEVKKQILSMGKIVEDILYLSRCEESITLETVDLNILVSRLLSYYQITLAEGNYKLVTDYCEDSYATTDSNLLLKILDNLITNAIVHSKEGATITISTKPNQLEIHNSNAHIDEELMSNIFEPFVSGNGKGHGLGLYIVNYYANILGAKVKICNEKDGVLTKVTFDPIIK